MLTLGRVVRFDEIRGYGFIRPQEGGEDVFMHANDLLEEKYLFRAGSEVEFLLEEGDKGLKASDIRLVNQPAPEPGLHPAAAAAALQNSAESVPGSAQVDEHVELLAVEDFRIDLTEALLADAESLTAEQLKAVRSCVVELVRKHGWIVD
ncbi:cold shock domain-containing protein [Streptomyces sp. NPDC059076]|uniref:cold shock domain-containing protein n=1 Tax=unclassified Streptomyces TaxID=2593676 RepID=UPI003678522E